MRKVPLPHKLLMPVSVYQGIILILTWSTQSMVKLASTMYKATSLVTILMVVLKVSDCLGINITMGVIFNRREFILDETQFRPAVDLSLEKVQTLVRNGDYVNFNLNYILKVTTSECAVIGINNSSGVTSDLLNNHDILAIIGPPCSFHAESVADLAYYWNIPILTGAAVSRTLEDKTRYGTLTRTALRSMAIADFLRQIFHLFNWNRCTLAYADIGYHKAISGPDILDVFERSDIEIQTAIEVKDISIETVTEMITRESRGKCCKCFVYAGLGFRLTETKKSIINQ